MAIKHFHFHECVVCDTTFRAERITAKYCSHRCRQEAYRDRIREKEYRLQEEKRKQEALSVTENIHNVTGKTDSVTQTLQPEGSVSQEKPLASGSNVHTGPYRHALEGIVSQPGEKQTEWNLPEHKEELKNCLEKLLSLGDSEIKRHNIRFLAYELRNTWVKVKRDSGYFKYFHSSLMEKEILPMLDKIISGINDGSQVFRFRITDDLRAEINKMIKLL